MPAVRSREKATMAKKLLRSHGHREKRRVSCCEALTSYREGVEKTGEKEKAGKRGE
jgi:hypothetical protein